MDVVLLHVWGFPYNLVSEIKKLIGLEEPDSFKTNRVIR
jgi:hypothetical protein